MDKKPKHLFVHQSPVSWNMIYCLTSQIWGSFNLTLDFLSYFLPGYTAVVTHAPGQGMSMITDCIELRLNQLSEKKCPFFLECRLLSFFTGKTFYQILENEFRSILKGHTWVWGKSPVKYAAIPIFIFIFQLFCFLIARLFSLPRFFLRKI